MEAEMSPVLDRYTQEGLGRIVRERISEADIRDMPAEIEDLLSTLRSHDERSADD